MLKIQTSSIVNCTVLLTYFMCVVYVTKSFLSRSDQCLAWPMWGSVWAKGIAHRYLRNSCCIVIMRERN